MSWRRLVALAGLFACQPRQEIAPPAWSGVRSTVLAIWPPDDLTPEVWAEDVSGPLPRFSAGPEDVVLLFGFEQPLYWLGVPPGRQSLLLDGPSLPEPTAAYRLADGAWGDAPDGAKDRARTIRLRTLAPICACYGLVDGTHAECRDCGDRVEPMVPTPPDEPELPRMLPCPTGWEASAEEPGVDLCRPIALATCSDGDAHFLGDSGCAPIGPACGPGRFPSVVGAAMYVDALAAPGGSGTEAAPFATIGDALAIAQSDVTVLVAPGIYREDLPIGPGVRIRGLCPRDTRWIAGTVVLAGAGIALESLTIEANLVVPANASLSLRNARVVGAASLEVDGNATIEDVELATSAADPLVSVGGVVGIQRANLELGPGPGLVVRAGGRLDAEDLRIDSAASVAGNGIVVTSAEIHAGRVAIAGAARGIDLDDAVATFDRVSIAASREYGVSAYESRLTLDHTSIDRSGSHQIFLSTAGTNVHSTATATITDLILLDGLERGLELTGYPALRMRRALVARSRDYDMNLGGGQRPEVEDLTIRGVGDSVARHESVIVYCQEPSRLIRVLIEDPGYHGMVIAGPATIADATVLRSSSGTLATDKPSAIELRFSLARSLSRIAVRDASRTAIGICGDSDDLGLGPFGTTILQDVEIERAEIGIDVGCDVAVDRAHVSETSADGVFVEVLETRATVQLEDLRIDGANRGAMGVSAGLRVKEGQAVVKTALITGSKVGLRRGGLGVLRSEAIEVSGNDVAISLPSFFAGDDFSGVTIRDNGVVYENHNLAD